MPSATASTVPIYQRIRDTVRERIESGKYKEGDRLPSENELVDEFGVARMTVRQALAQLVFENLIVRQPGMGTFVAAKKKVVTELDADSSLSFEEQVSAQGKTPALKLLSFGRVPSSPEVAGRLSLASGEPVYCLERLRYVDDELVGLEIRYFIAEIGDRIPMQSIKTMPTFDLLEAALGEPIQTVDVSMFAATANKEMGEKLNLRRGAAIMVRDHIVLDSRDRIVLYGNSIYRGNLRFRHVYRRARSGR